LRRFREQPLPLVGKWRRRNYGEIPEAAEAEAAVNRLQAAGVSWAGLYRFLVRTQTKDADMNLRSQIQIIALHWPAYGYLIVTCMGIVALKDADAKFSAENGV
jgi:hypothetical protein